MTKINSIVLFVCVAVVCAVMGTNALSMGHQTTTPIAMEQTI